MKIKKNDKVIVIAGREKGKTGIVQKVIQDKNQVVVENVNIRTYHVKPTQQNPQGGILKKEHPINASNVMLNVGAKKTIKVTRVGYKTEQNKNGKNDKKRVAKVNGEVI